LAYSECIDLLMYSTSRTLLYYVRPSLRLGVCMRRIVWCVCLSVRLFVHLCMSLCMRWHTRRSRRCRTINFRC